MPYATFLVMNFRWSNRSLSRVRPPRLHARWGSVASFEELRGQTMKIRTRSHVGLHTHTVTHIVCSIVTDPRKIRESIVLLKINEQQRVGEWE